MEKESLLQLATLSHPGRMAIYRLLMRRYPDEVPAGEIARALGHKPSTGSVYLSALTESGLIGQRRQGTSLLYRVRMTNVQRLMTYLWADCCRGRPDLCPDPGLPQLMGTTAMPDRKYNVLFICTGNSARSIFAEAILRKLAGDRFNAYSAGTVPRSNLNPVALAMLRYKDHDLAPLRAKNVAEFQGPGAVRFDFVFTVCNRAANEDCPVWEGQPVSAHWGMPDPVKATGTEAERKLAFQHAYGALQNRIRAFTALPMDQLDRISLQRAVDRIGSDEMERQ